MRYRWRIQVSVHVDLEKVVRPEEKSAELMQKESRIMQVVSKKLFVQWGDWSLQMGSSNFSIVYDADSPSVVANSLLATQLLFGYLHIRSRNHGLE